MDDWWFLVSRPWEGWEAGYHLCEVETHWLHVYTFTTESHHGTSNALPLLVTKNMQSSRLASKVSSVLFSLRGNIPLQRPWRYLSCRPITRGERCPYYRQQDALNGIRFVSNTVNTGEHLCHMFHEIGHRLDTTKRANPKKVEMIEVADKRSMSTATLISDFCKSYLSLPYVTMSSWPNASEKRLFLHQLLSHDYGVDEQIVRSTIPHLSEISSTSIRRVRDLCTPRYERIFHYILRLAQQDLGVAFLVKLRQDVREVIHCLRYSQHMADDEQPTQKDLSKLRAMERDIQTILSSLFRPGVLDLQQITYDKTPASIIEQIALKEAVHPLQSLNDLRMRLGPGRRCYAFFHPALRGSPLVFVHVALLRDIPESMNDLQDGTERIVNGTDLESEATCATFYSITNTEPGLVGVDLGNHLIKSVVEVLKNEFPTLDTFCTLSPIPNFRRWIQEKIDRTTTSDKFMDAELFSQNDLHKVESLFESAEGAPLVSLLAYLEHPQWYHSSGEINEELKSLLLKLVAYYLTVETHHGCPLCPVAKFHIRNGAEMYRLNYLGDTTPKGIRHSCGVMINYRYLLEDLEENRVSYERAGEIVVRDGVSRWLV